MSALCLYRLTLHISLYTIAFIEFSREVNAIPLSVPFLLVLLVASRFPFTATDALHACSPAASSAIKARAKHVSSFNPLFWMLRLLPVRERPPLRRKSRNCAHAARKRLRLNPANPAVGRTRRGLTTSPTTRCPRFIFYEIHRILLPCLALRDGMVLRCEIVGIN